MDLIFCFSIPLILLFLLIYDYSVTHHGFVAIKETHPAYEGMNEFGDTVHYPTRYELKIVWVGILWNYTRGLMVDWDFYNRAKTGSRITYRGCNYELHS